MPENKQLELEFDSKARALLTPEEIFAAANQDLLRDLIEDRRLEYKPGSIHCKELGEYFSMWANTAPAGGLIVVGVKNDTEFEGLLRLGAEKLNKLEATAEDYCPDANNHSRRVRIRRDGDGVEDFVLVFLVPYNETRVVRTTNGKVFIRVADRLKQLKTAEAIAQLQEQKGEVRFETRPCDLDYPAAFKVEAITEFAKNIKAAKKWDDYHTSESVLELMHLGVRQDGRFIPNIACALLFARDPRMVVPGCRIRFLRFEGERVEVGQRWNAVKDEFIDGTVPEQIEQAAQVLRSQLRTFSRLDRSGQFTTSPEYPEFAWYEAVVNACVHRSYGNGMKNLAIFIRMFDNKPEVESPGPFPPLVTPDNIEIHHPRNPFLMEAMYHMKFVRMAHEGVRRMRAEMAGMALPGPEFKQPEESHTVVRVTLRNNIEQRKVWVDSDVAAFLGKQVADTLSEEEKRCLNFIAEYGSITVSHAARITNRDWGTMDRRLRNLVDRGILAREAKAGMQRDPKARFVLAKPKDA